MKPWRAIVFDLDDTLFAERDYVLSGFRAIARWADERLNVPKADAYAALEGMFNAGVRGDTFNRWLVTLGQPTTLVPEMLRVYREHSPELSPFPGVPALLASLGAKYKLGLVSDGYLAVQQAKFRAVGLASRFHAVVFSDEWGREAWKPSTRPFQEIIARLDVRADESVYVADNPLKDFLGARSIGMSTIRARHCAGEYSCFDAPSPEHEADITVDRLDELQAYLLDGVR